MAAVAAGAERLDREPAFPHDAFAALRAAGLTTLDGPAARAVAGGPRRGPRRRLGGPDPGRAPERGRAPGRDRARVAARPRAAPRARGGCPAGRVGRGPRRRARGGRPAWTPTPSPGVKTFCSGAGGLAAALVLVRGDQPGPPLLAYVDLSEGVEIDRSWYRAAGHALVREPPRGLRRRAGPGRAGRARRDRPRARTSAATPSAPPRAGPAWSTRFARRRWPRWPSAPADDDLAALAAGRMVSAAGTIDAWFERAAAAVEADPGAPAVDLSVALRAAVESAARLTVDQAVRAAGSRPLAAAGRLDRARRDLELFLNQHRLDPLLASSVARPWGRERPTGGAPGAGLLRRPVPARRRPVGLRHQRLRARQVRATRWRRSATAPSPVRWRWAARSACSRRRWPASRGSSWRWTCRRRPWPPPRDRTAALDHVRVRQASLPEDMPAGRLRPDRVLRGPLLLGRAAAGARAGRAGRGACARRPSCWRCTGPSAHASTRCRATRCTMR